MFPSKMLDEVHSEQHTQLIKYIECQNKAAAAQNAKRENYVLHNKY